MPAESIVQLLRRHHRVPAAQLQEQLGVSRATLMRTVQAAGDSVLTIGRARRTSYAARRQLRGSPAPLPVFRVDEHASTSQVGELHLAYPDGCLFEFENTLEWPLDADMRDGWFEGIPYMLQDLRPDGFSAAHSRVKTPRCCRWVTTLEPGRTTTCSTRCRCLAPTSAATTSSVNRPTVAGRSACSSPLELVTDANVAQAYSEKAEHSMQHGTADSSAGGEFPKFTAVREFGELGGLPLHVIVKFSGSDESPGTERWSDLLICESLASQCVAGLQGLCAADSRIHSAGGRTFLEVVRFDRHEAHGRSAMCSWRPSTTHGSA